MVNDTANFIAGFGIIPNDWSCKTANEICTKISKGTTPSKSEISNEGNIPFLRVNNLTFYGRLALDSDFIFVSKESHENFLSRSMAFPNDILMNIVGPPLGKTALLDDSYPEYNMNQAIVFYRLQKNLVDSKYFLEFLNSFKAQQWLQSRSKKTSGQQNLTIEICKDLPIILPPLVEQKKIAQILSTWDQAISTTEKLLENSQQQKKALMQQLLTGKKRLLDENGMIFSSKWLSEKLEKICAISTGKKDVNEGNPNGIYPFFTCASEPTASDSYSYDCEALLIAGNGNLGKTHYIKGKFEAYQRTYILSKFDEKIQPLYLYQYILYWLMRDIEREKQHGAMPYIKLGLLQNFKIFIPSLTEQLKIIEVLSLADQEIETLQKKLDCLKQEKKALMQQLLTGKKRVKVAA